MKTFDEFPQDRAGAAATPAPAAVATSPAAARGKRSGLVWRVRALLRLARRALHARREYAELRHVDAETLRDLGLTPSEIGSVAVELRGGVAPTRRRTDFESRLESSRFRVREIDSAL